MRAPGARHGGAATGPQGGSPLPQEYAHGKVVPVRITDGFTQFLPPRTLTFFERFYFAAVPKPIMVAPVNGYPRGVPVMRIQAPQRQGIVIKSAEFQVYEHSGIAVDDIVQTPPSRTTTYFGFGFTIGNRNFSDYSTNASASLVPQAAIASGGGNLPAGFGSPAQATPLGGQIYPNSGPITPPAGEFFATYARPGEEMVATVFVLRPTEYDARLFSFKMSGWLAAEVDLDKILDMLGGPIGSAVPRP